MDDTQNVQDPQDQNDIAQALPEQEEVKKPEELLADDATTSEAPAEEAPLA